MREINILDSSDEEVKCFGSSSKPEPRKIKLENQLQVRDLLELDSIDIVRAEDLIVILPDPVPRSVVQKAKKKFKRAVRNTPLFRPRPRSQVNYNAGETISLPTTSARDRLLYTSDSIRASFRRLRKQVRKVMVSSEDLDEQVLEFRVTQLLPFPIWRKFQTLIDLTFNSLHVLVAELFELETSKSHMFMFKDSTQTERVLGDPVQSRAIEWEDAAIVCNLSSSHSMLYYAYNIEAPRRFEIRLTRVKSRSQSTEYPVVLGGRYMTPPSHIPIQEVEELLIQAKGNPAFTHPLWNPTEKFDLSTVRFSTFWRTGGSVTKTQKVSDV